VQDAEQQDGDRLGEIERVGRLAQDRLGLAQVGVEVGERPLGRAAQQQVGVGQHDWVVVDVDRPGVGREPLGHGVDVVVGGDAGADVEELPDANLAGEIPHRPLEEPPVRLHVPSRRLHAPGERRRGVLGELAVDREVGRPAQ
jgi:hypothetical protein